jgi:hypothetical protein
VATKRNKKVKDLDPKSRAKKVKGGNLPDDQRNINRSVGQVTKQVTKTAQSVGPTISKAANKAIHG